MENANQSQPLIMPDLETIDAVVSYLEDEHGISLTVNGYFPIPREDLPKFISSNEQYFADYYDVDVGVYRDFVRGVELKCSAITKKGKRCENHVHGVSYPVHDIVTYAGLHDGYCWVHGGIDPQS